MESSDIRANSVDLQAMTSASDQILMCLASSSKPIEAILRKFDDAPDKDVFVAALAWTLLLRHRQWQANANGWR